MLVSLLMHELLPLNLNFQVKNEQNNTFCYIYRIFLGQALLKHVRFLTFMASKVQLSNFY